MENEVNVKGVSLKELFKAYVEPEQNVLEEEQPQSPIGKAFASVWARLDGQGRSLTDGGTQRKKAKGKVQLQGQIKIEESQQKEHGKEKKVSSKSQSKPKGGNEIVD